MHPEKSSDLLGVIVETLLPIQTHSAVPSLSQSPKAGFCILHSLSITEVVQKVQDRNVIPDATLTSPEPVECHTH